MLYDREVPVPVHHEPGVAQRPSPGATIETPRRWAPPLLPATPPLPMAPEARPFLRPFVPSRRSPTPNTPWR